MLILEPVMVMFKQSLCYYRRHERTAVSIEKGPV